MLTAQWEVWIIRGCSRTYHRIRWNESLHTVATWGWALLSRIKIPLESMSRRWFLVPVLSYCNVVQVLLISLGCIHGTYHSAIFFPSWITANYHIPLIPPTFVTLRALYYLMRSIMPLQMLDSLIFIWATLI